MNNSIVKKANGLIKARYNFSLVQQKMIAFLIAKVKRSDEDFKDYEIPVPEFLEATGMSEENVYSQIKTEALAIMAKVIFLEMPNKTGKLEFKAFHWFSYFRYLTGEAVAQIHFDPVLKPYLLQLKSCFTEISLAYVLGMRSSYSIRLYEYLKMAAWKGAVSFDLEDFKKWLQIDKMPGYEQYNHIKARILLPAMKEITETTDIKVLKLEDTGKKHKRGNKVVAFTLYFETQVPPKEKEIRAETLNSLKSSATYDEILENFDPDPIPF